ncbi:MAG: hypothetical protein V9H26_18835 [Verrucomicrobiota bacterium]
MKNPTQAERCLLLLKTQRKRIALGQILISLCCSAHAQGTAFTSHGRLNDGGSAANGIYDLRLAIYDAAAGGNQRGPAVTNIATPVSHGLFTGTLDFGYGVFNGGARWLDLWVRSNGVASFTSLSPRQAVLPTPYAFWAAIART